LNDIKIKKKVVEDVIYLKNKEILAKIRRGNCILENLNEKTNKSEFVIARKGLIKFFDYQINSKKYSKENEIIWENLNKFFCRKDLYDLDTEQNGIYIYSTEKANGENLQLSYNKNYDAWIIGSKNVTIMLRNLKDLEFFKNYKENENVNINKKEFSPDKRFSYCIEFAELWFEILKDKIEDKNLLNEFKNDLNGFTLIGENIGDKTFEYRFLRKLREKIRSLKIRNIYCDTIIFEMKKECEDILGEEGYSFDLTKLLKFAEYVLAFVFKNGIKLNYEDNYAKFINSIKKSYDLSLNEMIGENESEKNLNICIKNELNEEIQKIMTKIKNQNIYESQNIDYFPKKSSINYLELNKDYLNKKFQLGKIYILSNIGLIGSGKSTVCKILENQIKNKFKEDLINLKKVSSDEINFSIKNNIVQENLTKKVKKQFNEKIKDFVKTSEKNKYNILNIDKNFNMQTLIDLIEK